MFTFLLCFFLAMQCCLFLSISRNDMVRQQSTVQTVNVNIVQSLAINLPQLKFTIIVIKTLDSLHQNIPPECTVILTT